MQPEFVILLADSFELAAVYKHAVDSTLFKHRSCALNLTDQAYAAVFVLA
jgi:sRNA-binding regulator protein Hfq